MKSLKPTSAAAYCNFKNCRHWHSCGFKVSQALRDKARAEGKTILIYKEPPKFCHEAKETEEK
jgi:putative ribosome biogenesis GTPase RsgA